MTRPDPASLPDPSSQGTPSRARVRLGLSVTLLGFFIFIVGAKPAWFGWDRSPTVGFIQISALLFGLGILCFGGYVGLMALWRGRERTIPADIGVRLVATGYVISVFAAMADWLGMGTQLGPEGPFFGPLQARGIMVGEAIIAVGFLMMIPFREKPGEDKKRP
ncbi:MAG: hypothetical protein JETCAE02_20490 [Anaerolineaceae bacterium]|nr:hypothetical protein [Anaerolineae bacterium]MBV6467162.1 hypothetical protein [Anaerolineales bacterium]MCE7906167.1 hypothetical protein [Anaerolineae bacterium CFX3]MDL1925084.1 hypothetical protein [Anaerolineae bacterium AMX1]OQY84236.1 MAG: hypothetical protein B6D40_05780 [Anaerolineae bacterium UTCFX3]GER78555.1 conserved hypothetical protein [Candidatus Denitrolinea symbiosum]GIK07992.1 MAG: hypothetical protein BroJett001_00580 [Chloroflexota bacterium]GJQ39637.1 MAG: hypothetic